MKPMTIARMVATLTALISLPCLAAAPRVDLQAGKDEVKILIGGKHVTTYIHADTLPKPSLYPVQTLGGVVVSRGYPLAKVEGETADHPHHVGLFFTYDEVNDEKFWNNTKTPPQIKHMKTVAAESGDNRGTLGVVMDWIGKDGKTVVLQEDRKMIFQPMQGGYSIDLDIVLTAKVKVEFGDTKEGMFALRTADWLREKGGTGKYFSSEGATDSKDIWGKRAKWVALEGSKDGKAVGIAILHHPSSVNYPTFWHARDYGLFSANPLGQEAFQKGTKAPNPTPLHLTLEPGKTARFRFLLMVYDGSKTSEQIESEFRSFTK